MFLIPEACIKCSWLHVYTSLVCFRDFAKNENTTENQAAAAYSLGQNTWRYKILFNCSCVKGSEINAKWNENLSQEDLRLSLVTGKEFLRKRHLNWDEVGGPERESGRNCWKVCRQLAKDVHVLNHSVVSDSCDLMDCSPVGSSVHGIFQARILKWVGILPPRGLPNSGIEPESPASPAVADGFFTREPPGKTPYDTWS